MKLHHKLKFFEFLNEAGHEITLVLVAVATLAAFASEQISMAGEFARMLGDFLHWVHFLALAVALAYLALKVGLTRNVSQEMASAIPESPDDQITTLFPPKRHYAYQDVTLSPDDVSFVTSADGADVEELAALNEDGFDGSAFELDHEKLRRRNADWIRKNGKVFMLVRSPERGAWRHIGYTCIVPLNDIGADVYLRGLIKDQDLPASLVCGTGEPTSTLLIFAAALRRPLRSAGSLGLVHLNRLLKATEDHVGVMAAAHAGHPSGILLWTQSEHPKMVTHLLRRGFVGTTPPTRSGDGFEMFRHRLVRPPQQPAHDTRPVPPHGAHAEPPSVPPTSVSL